MWNDEKRITRKIYVIIGLSLSILLGLFYLIWTDFDLRQTASVVPSDTPVMTAAPSETPEAVHEPEETPKMEPEVQIDVVSDDSYQRIVNRQSPLSPSYEPSDLTQVSVNSEGTQSLRAEAAQKLSELFTDARNDGIDLILISGYRSYQREQELYAFWVQYAGQAAADQIDCQPGYSEHQLGLAVDLGASNQACRLDECFAQTAEGQWLAQNAHRYGYILRYPQGKTDVTGIIYSPWNYRYVGEEEAQKLYAANLTMEEYYGVKE